MNIVTFSACLLTCALPLFSYAQGHHDHSHCDHANLAEDQTDQQKKAQENRLQFNASVVLDGYYFHDDSDEGVVHIRRELAGFGHGHQNDDHHHHEGLDNGFNLRHVEVSLSATVDKIFRGWTTIAVGEENVEVEEAVIQTLALPGNLQLSGGMFPSGIGLLNHQHSHDWDFFDQPLILEALFGSHGLVDKGIQLNWVSPGDHFLVVGAELLNGENEKSFQYLDAAPLSDHGGPRLFTAFAKFGPETRDFPLPRLGLSFATGTHQEAHDENEDETDDQWLEGKTNIYGGDLWYELNTGGDHGQGQVTVQAEYFYRERDLKVKQHDLVPGITGNHRRDDQDGYYLQALYGIAPKWRVGMRWEEIGLRNKNELPDGTREEFGSSQRWTTSIDWRNSHSSLVRLHVARGRYETDDGLEKAWEIALQWQVSFGN